MRRAIFIAALLMMHLHVSACLGDDTWARSNGDWFRDGGNWGRSAAAPVDMSAGSTLLWEFNGIDPAVWVDSSSNGFDGTVAVTIDEFVTNAPSGKVGSYSFDGSTVEANLGLGIVTNLAAVTQRTYSAWVYLHSDGQGVSGRLLDCRDSGTTKGDMWLFNNGAGGKVSMFHRSYMTGTDATGVSDVSIETGKWYHVVSVFNRDGDNTFDFYTNAVVMSLGTDTAGTGATDWNLAQPLCMGDDYSNGRHLDAFVREVGAWDKALSLTEITNLYNDGFTIADANLQGAWAMTNPAIPDASQNAWPGIYGEGLTDMFIGNTNNTYKYMEVRNDVAISEPSSLTSPEPGDDFSWGAWIYPTQTVDRIGYFLGKTTTDLVNEPDFFLRTYTDGTGALRAKVFDSQTNWIQAIALTTIPTDTWTHVSAKYTGTNLWIYTNDVITDTTNYYVGAFTNMVRREASFYVGKLESSPFIGHIAFPWVATNNHDNFREWTYTNYQSIVNGLIDE